MVFLEIEMHAAAKLWAPEKRSVAFGKKYPQWDPAAERENSFA